MGSKEALIVAKLIIRGEPVPDDLLEAALEFLEVMMLGLDKERIGDRYILERIIEGIKNKDRDALIGAIELVPGMWDLGDGDADASNMKPLKATDATIDLVDGAAHAFVENEIVSKGWPENMGWAVLDKLTDQNFIPLRYKSGFLLGFDQKLGDMLMFSVNKHLGIEEFLGDNTAELRADGKLVDAVRDQWDISEDTIEMHFVNMKLRFLGDNKFELILTSAK